MEKSPNARQNLETDRLILKPSGIEDADFVFRLLNTPKWIQFIGDRGVYSIEDAEKYIQERMLPQYERLGFGNFTVIRKSDGMKMGSCGIYDRIGIEGLDIGFAFLPEFEGKGYGFEAAMAVKDAAFTQFGLKHLGAITTSDNVSSQKLLEKIGLKFSKNIQLPGDDEVLWFYELRI